jgi:predicted aconitase with swiveling domain
MSFTIQCRSISKGKAKGEIIVSKDPITFLSGVDPETGIVMEKGHAIEGRSIAGKVLVFPHGKGSTVGSYIVYALKKNGKAPAAIVNNEAETIIATGAIIADLPMVDKPSQDINSLKDGMIAEVDGNEGIILIED